MGSTRIGKELVRIISTKHEKCSIIILDRLEPNLDQFKNTIKAHIHYFFCDVSSPESVAEVAAKLKVKGLEPTMVVNNAGIVNGKKFLDVSDNDLERIFKINVLGHFYILKNFLPKMIEKNAGHVLAVGSVMGLTAAAYAADYCASKFAVTGYMEALRQELEDTNICCSTIYPGLIDTGMFTGVSHSNDWMTPRLSPQRVAHEMYNILNSQTSTEVQIPFYTRFTPLLRMLPLELNDLVHYLTGANKDLAGFTHSVSSVKLEEKKK